MKNYEQIRKEEIENYKCILSMPNLVSSEAIAVLERKGVRWYRSGNAHLKERIMYINHELLNRINN